ncbi:MAG: OmpA family protein [Bacteroidales bacterium]|nr:OmpA family protein [Bacteroidales bacterium]
MKKVFITMIALLAVSSSVMAAGHVDSVRYLTTKFGKNWFISASATGNWWQGSMRTPEALNYQNSYTAVEWGKPDFGFNASFGKWLNHCTGLRMVYSNTRIHSYIKLNPGGAHTQHLQYLFGDDPQLVEGTGENAIYATSMRYHNLRVDYMVSPIDFFQGYYNPDRFWTPVLYVSGGASVASNDFFAIKSMIEDYKVYNYGYDLESGLNFELALSAGLANNFRLSDHFDINLDLNWTTQRWTLDSWRYEFVESSGTRPKRLDNMYTASLGLTYFFNREYDLPINCCAELDSIKDLLPVFVHDTVPVHDTIVKFVNLQTEDVLSYPFSIFFNRDSYQLMSRRDIVNLSEIANVAKENGYKLRLTGSCDSATATPSYNQTLSENRCNKIKIELLELGVPEDQIIIEPIGGVKKLDPTEYDRRVLIQLVKEAQK